MARTTPVDMFRAVRAHDWPEVERLMKLMPKCNLAKLGRDLDAEIERRMLEHIRALSTLERE